MEPAEPASDMAGGMLETVGDIRIRLGPNKEIATASDPVFAEENQEEARIVIYEADYLLEYVSEFSSSLNMGAARFASVTEPGRQTTFRYNLDMTQDIALTRAHRGVEQILKELESA